MPDTTPHEPTPETRRTVEAMAAYGIPQKEIAVVVGVSDRTLRKHYRAELDRAEVVANSKVAAFLYTAASGKAIRDGATYADCIRAGMFWLKTRAGWKEIDRHELTGPDGGPIQTEDTGARDKLADLLARKSAGSGAGGDTGGAE